MYKKISKCRVCSNSNIVKVLDLGVQVLTGVFPKSITQLISSGPLHLVKCVEDENDACGLLQLGHSFDTEEMYGDNYGYRSGLNQSMVDHLTEKVKNILSYVELNEGNIVLDIGSNDGTTLSAYPDGGFIRVGIDPTAFKFRQYYPSDVKIISDFFSSIIFKENFPNKKAKIITSFSMFYDLESPLDFVRQVRDILDENGVWVFEQSYMPLMLSRNSYDTVCHEHLEYYGLRQIKWILGRCDLKIIDVKFNDINGGSFSITASHITSDYKESTDVKIIERRELLENLNDIKPYLDFAERANESRIELRKFINNAHLEGKRIAVLGASTKGNVLLQYCGIDYKEVEYVAEINTDKFGSYTPGSLIPILSEEIIFNDEPDYLIVLPWHFKTFFVNKYKFKKCRLVFPLPKLHVID